MSSRSAMGGHFAIFGNQIPEFPIYSVTVHSPTMHSNRRAIGTLEPAATLEGRRFI
jgi:hypothetical protein